MILNLKFYSIPNLLLLTRWMEKQLDENHLVERKLLALKSIVFVIEIGLTNNFLSPSDLRIKMNKIKFWIEIKISKPKDTKKKFKGK